MTVAEFEEAIHGESYDEWRTTPPDDYDVEWDEVLTAEYPECEHHGGAGYPAWEDELELLAELRDAEESDAGGTSLVPLETSLYPYDLIEVEGNDGYRKEVFVRFSPRLVNGEWRVWVLGSHDSYLLASVKRIWMPADEGDGHWYDCETGESDHESD